MEGDDGHGFHDRDDGDHDIDPDCDGIKFVVNLSTNL